MLTHHRKPVCLSLLSTDLPVWSVIETAATVYQKDQDRFHILLTEPAIYDIATPTGIPELATLPAGKTSRLLWLEISPQRAIMTMQGNGQFSYRHLWERGMYGISRFWLQGESLGASSQIRLRNYTRSLTLTGKPLPDHLRLEYDLWSDKVQLGRYILNLQIHQ